MAGRSLKLRWWKQEGPVTEGRLEDDVIEEADPSWGFLDALERLNARRRERGLDPVAFDYACKNGKCGQCSLAVNGRPHGPPNGTTICRTKVGEFPEGEVLVVEPFRARAFPLKQDLSVDRSAMERLLGAGGFMSVPTSGGLISNESGMYHHPDGNPVDACIQCGACIAGCPTASAALFLGAMAHRMGRLEPEGQEGRVLAMAEAADEAGFGACSDRRVCEAVCPKGLSLELISGFNRAWIAASWRAALAGRRRTEGP